MNDLVWMIAGPSVAAAVGIAVGVLIGRWSNVERQVDARLARELAPLPIELEPPAGSRFAEDLAAFKAVERHRMAARHDPVGVYAHLCGQPSECELPAWECHIALSGGAS